LTCPSATLNSQDGRLTLINERSSVRREINDGLLGDLPDSLVDCLELGGDGGDVLNRSTGSDNEVLHIVIPKTEVDEISKQPGADDLEVTRQDSSSVKHRCVWLETGISYIQG